MRRFLWSQKSSLIGLAASGCVLLAGLGMALAQTPTQPGLPPVNNNPVTVVPSPCTITSATSTTQQPKTDYSATIGASSVPFVPAAPSGVIRTGLFVELLTASATLAVNPAGGSASTTAAGNIVISTGATAPNNVAYINFASMGFIPQGALTAIADAGGRAVTAIACPG